MFDLLARSFLFLQATTSPVERMSTHIFSSEFLSDISAAGTAAGMLAAYKKHFDFKDGSVSAILQKTLWLVPIALPSVGPSIPPEYTLLALFHPCNLFPVKGAVNVDRDREYEPVTLLFNQRSVNDTCLREMIWLPLQR